MPDTVIDIENPENEAQQLIPNQSNFANLLQRIKNMLIFATRAGVAGALILLTLAIGFVTGREILVNGFHFKNQPPIQHSQAHNAAVTAGLMGFGALLGFGLFFTYRQCKRPQDNVGNGHTLANAQAENIAAQPG